MSELLDSALAKLQQAADDYPQSATLSTNECRVLLIELDGLRSTAAITATPSFRDRVKRYRKTGVCGVTPEEIEEIPEIRRVELRPGDIIVVTYQQRLNAEVVTRIVEQLKAKFGDQKVVVLDSGGRVDVLAPTDATTLPDEDSIRKAMQAAKASPGRVVSVDEL